MFSELGNGGKFTEECVKIGNFFLKSSFSDKNSGFFDKSEIFQVGKSRYIAEVYFF